MLTFEQWVKTQYQNYFFWAATVAYKDGKIDLDQYKEDIANILRALAYQGFSGTVNEYVKDFKDSVDHLVEYLPNQIITFNERMAAKVDMEVQ